MAENSGGKAPGSSARSVPPRRIPYSIPVRAEMVRKTIHTSSVIMPVAVGILPAPVPLVLLLGAVTTALAIEWARRRMRWARLQFLRRTRWLLRPHERLGFAGATYMAVAYLVAFLVFPLQVAVVAMLYNGLGDGVAAVVGRRYGRRRLASGKSMEGALAGFSVNFLAGLAVPGISTVPALIGAAGAALIELAPVQTDDNLTVTLGGGLTLYAALALL